MVRRSFGGYICEESLSIGLFGESFRARNKNGAEASILVVDSELSRRSGIEAGIARYGAQLKELIHPHIVTTQTVGRGKDGRLVVIAAPVGAIVLLNDLMDRPVQDPLPLYVALRIVMSVVKGLAHAHSKGIIHGAVHPRSVTIDHNGVVKLTDFCVARAFSTAAAAPDNFGLLDGLRGYLASELTSGKPPQTRTDVFAAGVLTCQLLWQQATPPSNAPLSLVTLLRRAVHGDATKRYKHAGEMESALRRAIRDESLTLASDAQVSAFFSNKRPNSGEIWLERGGTNNSEVSHSADDFSGNLEIIVDDEVTDSIGPRVDLSDALDDLSLLDDDDDEGRGESNGFADVTDGASWDDSFSHAETKVLAPDIVAATRARETHSGAAGRNGVGNQKVGGPLASGRHGGSPGLPRIAVTSTLGSRPPRGGPLSGLGATPQGGAGALDGGNVRGKKPSVARSSLYAGGTSLGDTVAVEEPTAFSRSPFDDDENLPDAQAGRFYNLRMVAVIVFVLAILIAIAYTKTDLFKVAQNENQTKKNKSMVAHQKRQPKAGKISIQSETGEAAVWLLLGRTPVESFPLSSDMVHELRIGHEGFRTLFLSVTAQHWSGQTEERKAHLSATLVRADENAEPVLPAFPPENDPPLTPGGPGQGAIVVESQPEGAEVWLWVGTTPLSELEGIEVGKDYEFKVLKDGYSPAFAVVKASDWFLSGSEGPMRPSLSRSVVLETLAQ